MSILRRWIRYALRYGHMPGRDTLCRLFGLALYIFLWQVAAMRMHGLVIAPPGDTVAALLDLMGTESFFREHFLLSFQRIFSGIFLGAAVGFVLGMAAGLCRDIRHFLEPFFWVLMSVPAVVVVVIAMLWFGMGTRMVVFIASVLLSPVIYINTVKGMAAVDHRLVEMADLYGFSLWMKIRHVYFMSLVAPLSSALAIIVGNGVRIVVLAEVLGTNNGIGFALSTARTCLDMPQLYACVLLCLLVVFVFEYLLLRPLQNYLTRWRP